MIRGNNNNTTAPPFLDNRPQYLGDVSNQLQLCGNVPFEFNANPVNYLGNNHGPSFHLPNKSPHDAEAIPNQQKLQFSLYPNQLDGKVSIVNQNHVSTGLRLSYDEDERNSSFPSGNGSISAAASSLFSSMRNDIRRELDQQKEELQHFIRAQEDNMVKGVRDIKQRHMAAFLAALENGICKKLHEKDLELDAVTRKNKELVESVKQVTNEAQNWCYMAKYNESLVNVLKTNLQQAMQGSNNYAKEGVGENDVDDAVSCTDPNNHLVNVASGSGSGKKDMKCRACQVNKVAVLLMPCRHLCLCKECAGFVSVCPVCQMITSASFEVFLS